MRAKLWAFWAWLTADADAMWEGASLVEIAQENERREQLGLRKVFETYDD